MERREITVLHCGAQAVLGPVAVGALGPVPAEVGQIAVDIGQRDGSDKVEVHIHNGDVPVRQRLHRMPSAKECLLCK